LVSLLTATYQAKMVFPRKQHRWLVVEEKLQPKGIKEHWIRFNPNTQLCVFRDLKVSVWIVLITLFRFDVLVNGCLGGKRDCNPVASA